MGINDEARANLFTKGFGKNHGLGLFLSQEILAITGIMITENGMPGHGGQIYDDHTQGWPEAGLS